MLANSSACHIRESLCADRRFFADLAFYKTNRPTKNIAFVDKVENKNFTHSNNADRLIDHIFAIVVRNVNRKILKNVRIQYIVHFRSKRLKIAYDSLWIVNARARSLVRSIAFASSAERKNANANEQTSVYKRARARIRVLRAATGADDLSDCSKQTKKTRQR